MTRPGGSGEPPPRGEDDVPGEDTEIDVDVRTQERYYRLDGVVFRVRLDRLEQGAEYLRRGRWVWTPITSGSVIANRQAKLLSSAEAEAYQTIK
jgi:hypothetical protein